MKFREQSLPVKLDLSSTVVNLQVAGEPFTLGQDRRFCISIDL